MPLLGKVPYSTLPLLCFAYIAWLDFIRFDRGWVRGVVWCGEGRFAGWDEILSCVCRASIYLSIILCEK